MPAQLDGLFAAVFQVWSGFPTLALIVRIIRDEARARLPDSPECPAVGQDFFTNPDVWGSASAVQGMLVRALQSGEATPYHLDRFVSQLNALLTPDGLALVPFECRRSFAIMVRQAEMEVRCLLDIFLIRPHDPCEQHWPTVGWAFSTLSCTMNTPVASTFLGTAAWSYQ